MVFILDVQHKPTGYTHITYDVGPTARLNLMTLTEVAHETLMVPPDDLVTHTLTEVRPPARRNKR